MDVFSQYKILPLLKSFLEKENSKRYEKLRKLAAKSNEGLING
jgi:hypothetical protein